MKELKPSLLDAAANVLLPLRVTCPAVTLCRMADGFEDEMPFKSRADKKKYQREWWARRRAEYIAKHGGKCSRCPATHGLEFDHIDPNLKTNHRIWSWKRERIEAELAKCQLLCDSCHIAKTNEDFDQGYIKHGTDNGYQNGCKCAECKAAHAYVVREWRGRANFKVLSVSKAA